MRWSQLRVKIEELFDPALALKVHCTVQRGEHGARIGRYWFVLDGETIWDEPKRVSRMLVEGEENSDAAKMGEIFREYLSLSRENLLHYSPADDIAGLSQLLRAADRRIGKRRFSELAGIVQHPAAHKIILARCHSEQ